MPTAHFQSTLPFPARTLYDWHAHPGAFERLMPPWETMTVVHRQGGIREGGTLAFDIHQGPFSLRWKALHQAHIEGRQFQDTQAKGPFARWVHTHKFVELGAETSLLDDAITYRLPLHPVSSLVAGWFVRRMLHKMFTFRHRRTMNDLARHAAFSDRDRQVVAIAGGTGFVGQALCPFLTTGGHNVRLLTRSPKKNKVDPASGVTQVAWDPAKGELDPEALHGVDVVINLAGESINQRWTEEAKARILESRTQSTAFLARTIASLPAPPHTFLSTSASGYYGSRGDQVLTEGSRSGENFLAKVCVAWEAAAAPAKEAGIRVVHPRLGVVLEPSGGALEQMLPPFKMGIGGKIGDGRQYMSWISRDDVVGALYFLMFTPEIEGPVNLSAPNPVTNAAFTKTLGRVLGRPTLLPTPTFALKALLGGEAAKAMLLEGQRMVPKVLEAHGFTFLDPELEGALRRML